MTNENRTPAEIEREIEHERAGLTDTLDNLQDKFSVETIARQLSDQFREHGGDVGRSISEAVKRNPVALALTGVGLAWLMMGDRTERSIEDRSVGMDQDRRSDRGNRTSYRPELAQDRVLGPQPGNSTRPYYSGRSLNQDDGPSWARSNEDASDSPGMGRKMREAAGSASHHVSSAASSTMDATQKAGATVADTAKGAAGAISGAARSVADSAQSFGAAASEQAAALRDRLAEGTETFSEEARNAVVAARERAIHARDAAYDYGRQGRDKAVDLFEDHPMIAGALALAVGSAIAAALPRSRTEDAYLGEESDRLMHEAERIFADEKAKLSKVAHAATDEAKKVAREVGDNVGGQAKALADKAKASGDRIADAAKTEAKKQDLGKVDNA